MILSKHCALAKPALSAWERWEMGVLRQPLAAATASRPVAERPLAPPPSPTPPASRVDATELHRLRHEARAAGEAEGRRDGWAQGHTEGHSAGLAAGLAAATAHAEQLRALAATLPDALHRAQTELADTLLSLALDVARQVVHRTLRTEPEWVLALVQDLLHAEPALQGKPRLLLHSDDVALVQNSLGNELQRAGWQVRADDTLERGGCRVQSASGEMDATLDTRWKNVTAAMRPDVETSQA